MAAYSVEWIDKNGKAHFKSLSKRAAFSYVSFLLEDGAHHVVVSKVK